MGLISAFTGLTSSFARTVVRRARHGPARPDWSLWHETLFVELRELFAPLLGMEPAAQRAFQEAQVLPSAAVRRTIIEPSAAPRGEWLTPPNAEPGAAVLYLHGGGYCTGSVRTYRELAANIAIASRARTLVLDYPLAPESPFPAALEDSLAAVRSLPDRGQLVLAGDSAGGNLCLQTLFALRDAGEPLPAGAALICPWVDMSLSSPSVEANAPFDWVDLAVAHTWRSWYLPQGDHRDPRWSPLFADLRGLPPLLIHTGSAEMLHDEDLELARRAQAAGVRVELLDAPGMVHDWHLCVQVLAEARSAIAHIGAFVREVTRRPAQLEGRVDAAPERIPG
jgi:acetyl esterase/lipase